MNDLRKAMVEMAREFELEDNAVSDLWTWLPTYEVVEHFHETLNYMPPNRDIIKEAAMYLASIEKKYYDDFTEKMWFAECPCGDPDHIWIGPKYQAILDSRGEK